MLILMLLAGLWFTAGSGFWQIRHFSAIFKNTFGRLFKSKASTAKTGITPFQAMSTALASTVGTGNIAGVATAITAGGPGAIFWMWISALLGMMTKYAEVVLAVHYRHKNEDSHYVGGPMYTIERGLGRTWRWLAVLFSIFTMTASIGVGNITQINTMAEALNTGFGIPPLLTGACVLLLAGAVILGGIRSISHFCEFLVPFMSAVYILAAACVLFVFRENILPAFQLIIQDALRPSAAAGGVGGYFVAIRMGVGRGIFSNEAGLGSAPIAHAAAETNHPVQQGMWGAAEVFIDTILICTITALVILCSGAYTPNTPPVTDGASLTMYGFNLGLGSIGSFLSTICTTLFALATILGWSFYGERCCEYLFNSKWAKRIYRCAYIFLLLPGACLRVDTVWALADFLNNLMAAPNLVSLFALSGVVFKLTKDYKFTEK